MEVVQAEAFLAVAEELHFGRAAQRLQMGQPPLSRLIKKLERQLGAELFNRTSRTVELTTAGKALIEPAQQLVAASEHAVEAVQETVSGQAGRVKIGFAGASSSHAVGALAAQLHQTHPDLRVEVNSAQFAGDCLNKVLDGSLDFGMGLWEHLPADIDSLVIGLDEVVLALPAGHRLASAESVRIKDLAAESWINLPGGHTSALQNRFKRLTLNAGFVPRKQQTAPDSWTVMVLVGVGMGVSMSLSSVARRITQKNVRFVRIADEHNPPLQLRLIWRKDAENPAQTPVRELAGQLFDSGF